MQNTDFHKGTLQTIVLKLLSDHDRMYGYEITQKVKELSDGQLIFTEGALYPTLHKLESEGLLDTETEFLGKRVRKYYRLTKTGKLAVNERIEEFIGFLKTMNNILKINLVFDS